MGVKSTYHATRGEAEEMAIEMYLQLKKNKIRAKFVAMSDKELEDWLEEKNDKLHDGEGFKNYLIGDKGYW